MKTKGTNSEVCHAWASQSQDEMSNNNGSLYFEGNTIYSYGGHFPIATHIDGDVVLFTIQDYSVTTSSHKSGVLQSIYHKTIFKVDDLTPGINGEFNHIQNLKSYDLRFKETLNKASRAHSNKSFLLGEAIGLAEEANNYATYFGVDHHIETGDIDLDSIKLQLDKLKVEEVKKDRERKKQLLIDNSQKIKDWRNGSPVILPYDVDFLLRVIGDDIETSQGAKIPLNMASKLWSLIQRARNNHKTYKPEGFKVGHYNLKSINENGDLQVDCHLIKYSELELMAGQLNLN